VPAAAVIPAPIAYIKVVAVKKLVVGSRCTADALLRRVTSCLCVFNGRTCGAFKRVLSLGRHVYFELIKVLKAGDLSLVCSCME
jgi:hypothetical protein